MLLFGAVLLVVSSIEFVLVLTCSSRWFKPLQLFEPYFHHWFDWGLADPVSSSNTQLHQKTLWQAGNTDLFLGTTPLFAGSHPLHISVLSLSVIRRVSSDLFEEKLLYSMRDCCRNKSV